MLVAMLLFMMVAIIFYNYLISQKTNFSYFDVVTLLEDARLASKEGSDEFDDAEDISVIFLDLSFPL